MIEQVDAALAKGDCFSAYDQATAGIEKFPDSLILKHRAVLTLARLGASERALRLYSQWKLSSVRIGDSKVDADMGALEGRLLKDLALQASETKRLGLLTEAARRYLEVFERTGDPYPGVNAAALYLWAGQVENARRIASASLGHVRGNDFYAHATRAEGNLILGHIAEVFSALETAARAGGDPQSRAVARRQMRRTCTFLKISETVLDPIRVQPIIRFSGHMPGKRFPREFHAQAEAGIRKLLDRIDANIGYGSLAAGADILFAEALLERGGELNVVLPFSINEFRRVSVVQAGADWLARFEACLERASSLRLASDDLYLGDDSLFMLGSELANGLAVLRADMLDTEAIQTAIWDGEPPGGTGGTGDDVMQWDILGRPQLLLRPDGQPLEDLKRPTWTRPATSPRARQIHAVVFGDVAGFSRLSEIQVSNFFDAVFGSLAHALQPFEEKVLARNTWGDGLFLVFDDVPAAAGAALALQERAATLDLAKHDLPQTLGLRLGAHLCPMTKLRDPIAARETWVGVQVSRASRIEPVVPAGAVYVTETFAAALALLPGAPFAADYIGRVEAAKSAGSMPLFRLRRRVSLPEQRPSRRV